MKTVNRRTSLRTVFRAGAAAAVWSAAINAVIFVMGALSATLPDIGLLPNTAGFPALVPVIVVSAFGAIGGAAVYGFFLVRSRNPFHFFLVVAGIVTLLSLMAPLSLAGFGTDVVFLLTIMHVITAGLTIAYMHQIDYPAPVHE
jgi:hypothetical protein